MTIQTVTEIVRQALWTAFWLSAPLLAAGFIAGIALSLLQIVTSLQDPSFSSVPRLAVFLAALILLLPWILERLVSYTSLVLANLGRYAH